MTLFMKYGVTTYSDIMLGCCQKNYSFFLSGMFWRRPAVLPWTLDRESINSYGDSTQDWKCFKRLFSFKIEVEKVFVGAKE